MNRKALNQSNKKQLILKKFIFLIGIFSFTNNSDAQLSTDAILKNKIKTVKQEYSIKGVVLSGYEKHYNIDAKIEEDTYFNFNSNTNTNNHSKNRYHYKNNHIVRTVHYVNDLLTDSIIHHTKWDSQNWTFTDTAYLIANGKIRVRQDSKTEDDTGIHFITKTFVNDSIQDEENRNVCQLNDSTRIIVEMKTYYYKGAKRIYQRDSVIEITGPNTLRQIRWEDGVIKSSFLRKYTDSVCRYEMREEPDFNGKHKIKHETWYDESGREIKSMKNEKNKTKRHFTYETHHWKGMRTEEKTTYEGKKRMVEKIRSEYDQRDLPQHTLFYDKNDNIIGKIKWEYEYW